MAAKSRGGRGPYHVPAGLARELQRAKLTPNAFGKQIGLTAATISMRMRGHTKWSLDDLVIAAQVLGVPLTRLVE